MSASEDDTLTLEEVQTDEQQQTTEFETSGRDLVRQTQPQGSEAQRLGSRREQIRSRREEAIRRQRRRISGNIDAGLPRSGVTAVTPREQLGDADLSPQDFVTASEQERERQEESLSELRERLREQEIDPVQEEADLVRRFKATEAFIEERKERLAPTEKDLAVRFQEVEAQQRRSKALREASLTEADKLRSIEQANFRERLAEQREQIEGEVEEATAIQDKFRLGIEFEARPDRQPEPEPLDEGEFRVDTGPFDVDITGRIRDGIPGFTARPAARAERKELGGELIDVDLEDSLASADESVRDFAETTDRVIPGPPGRVARGAIEAVSPPGIALGGIRAVETGGFAAGVGTDLEPSERVEELAGQTGPAVTELARFRRKQPFRLLGAGAGAVGGGFAAGRAVQRAPSVARAAKLRVRRDPIVDFEDVSQSEQTTLGELPAFSERAVRDPDFAAKEFERQARKGELAAMVDEPVSFSVRGAGAQRRFGGFDREFEAPTGVERPSEPSGLFFSADLSPLRLPAASGESGISLGLPKPRFRVGTIAAEAGPDIRVAGPGDIGRGDVGPVFTEQASRQAAFIKPRELITPEQEVIAPPGSPFVATGERFGIRVGGTERSIPFTDRSFTTGGEVIPGRVFRRGDAADVDLDDLGDVDVEGVGALSREAELSIRRAQRPSRSPFVPGVTSGVSGVSTSRGDVDRGLVSDVDRALSGARDVSGPMGVSEPVSGVPSDIVTPSDTSVPGPSGITTGVPDIPSEPITPNVPDTPSVPDTPPPPPTIITTTIPDVPPPPTIDLPELRTESDDDRDRRRLDAFEKAFTVELPDPLEEL